MACSVTAIDNIYLYLLTDIRSVGSPRPAVRRHSLFLIIHNFYFVIFHKKGRRANAFLAFLYFFDNNDRKANAFLACLLFFMKKAEKRMLFLLFCYFS